MDPNVVLQAMRVDGMEGLVYVLGCYERRVTIYSQQVRALNLIDALHKTGHVQEKRLAVIGAGVAGLTAAGGALIQGAEVTLLERGPQCLPLFRQSPKRWLHPYVYDWPRPGWDRARAGLPILDWKAGLVAEVLPEWQAGWERCACSRLRPIYAAEDVAVHADRSPVRVSWNARLGLGRHTPANGLFDVVILAVGFGLESSTLPDYRGYWEPDDIDVYQAFREGKDAPKSWFVSGLGDGALMDLFRLRLKDFRHEQLMEQFLGDPRLTEVEQRILEIEQDPRAWDGASDFLARSYMELPAVDSVVQEIHARLRPDTTVTLNGLQVDFFDPRASALNRFLLGQLRHVGAFRYITGEYQSADRQPNGRFVVRLKNGTKEEFDRVLLRHGPQPAAIAVGFGAVDQACAALKEAWKTRPQLLDQTRARRWEEATFGPEDREGLSRSRGRTPGGALRGINVYIAGTAPDLDDHRQAVDDAIVGEGGVVVAANPFDAGAMRPVHAALAALAAANAVIVVLAYRCPWVPGEADGGDGNNTITELEIQAADHQGKPVFAFVAATEAAWTADKEQDRLRDPAADPVEVQKRVLKLDALKRTLQGRPAIQFDTPGALAESAQDRLAQWVKRRSTPPAFERVLSARIVHPLQSTRHFQGRQDLLRQLRDWWADPASPDRVVSLEAIGGAGKTAVAERFLRHVLENPTQGGVFVWSFYEAPHTDAFLKAACEYFVGSAGEKIGGRLERLKSALRDGPPHLLLLDGLERVQSSGDAGETRGELLDQPLKILLRGVAGGLGRVRALITSRYPLIDLARWKGSGYRAEPLENLDVEAARRVLRDWGVMGDARDLDALAVQVDRHALSTAVLGSYLGKVCGGDPSRMPQLDLAETAQGDPMLRKLQRLLGHYAQALSDEERQVMAWLSLYARGVSMGLLATLVRAGSEVAGVLVGADEVRLLRVLQQLEGRGLLFSYRDKTAELMYTAHPFLRDHFRSLLNVAAENVHEAVRASLAATLEERPGTPPSDPELLDRYELLVEETRLAGRVAEAFDLYWFAMGSYDSLGKRLGDYARGVRMLLPFCDPATLMPQGLEPEAQAALVNALGLFAGGRGELGLVERCFESAARILAGVGNTGDESTSLRNLAEVRVWQGNLPSATATGAEALARAEETDQPWRAHIVLGILGFAEAMMGFTRSSIARFERAAAINEGPQYTAVYHFHEALCRARRGDLEGALQQSRANLEKCKKQGLWRDRARLHALLGNLILPDDPAEARRYLGRAREWSTATGDVEVILLAHQLGSRIAFQQGDLATALAEASEGRQLAQACGYGLYAINLGCDLARAFLAQGEPRVALNAARAALDAAVHLNCRYAWGRGDAAHICGLAHEGLGERDHARRRLHEALMIREDCGDPLAAESRTALARVDSPS